MDRIRELLEGQMTQTQSYEFISTRQEKLVKLAQIEPKQVLTTLAHHIDLVWLHEAYRRTRKDGAAGVDGVTAAAYEANLEANLWGLLDRFKSGRYRAPAVRRVHIPKPGKANKTRPIGIPTLEDKVLQRAVLMVLEPVYEQDFLACSYGFRPGRSAHQALDALWRGLMDLDGGWIIDLDIQSFFDEVEWEHLRHFLDQRVRDGVIRRVIGKWLNAGVMESGAVSHPDRGTPQGGVISPLLSNLYLHEVLDLWFEHEVKPRLRLHPEKTRLVDFRSPPRAGSGSQRERSFDLLGFTQYWGRSRKGRWITGNAWALARFLWEVRRLWHKWLNRRSSGNCMTWAKFVRLIARYPLPPPRVVHSVYRRVATL